MSPDSRPPEPSVQVTDVRALRALAHPLRNRLLGLLRLDGPSTATLLGQRVRESSGSTSYHLRQLAAYGFVEELPGHGTGRTRVLNAWLGQREALGPGWAAAGSLSDYAVRLTPAQAQALAAELGEVVGRWLAEHPSDVPAEGSELVSVLVDVVPLREWPT